MADPVATPYEILRHKKRTTCRQKCGEINPHCQCDCEAEGDISALEAAGWKIVHPEKVTLSMTAYAVECRDIESGHMAEILATAISRAPLHGKG